MSAPLTVPASAIDDDWIISEFEASLRNALVDLVGGTRLKRAVLRRIRLRATSLIRLARGGVIWLRVDSAIEGNYLLEQVRQFADRHEVRNSTLAVSKTDPYLLWELLVGFADDPSTTWRTSTRTIVCIQDGFWLPPRLLHALHDSIVAYTRMLETVLIVPVAAAICDEMALSPHMGPSSFQDIDEARRHALALALVRQAFPNEVNTWQGHLAGRLVAANPSSRAELRAWIDHIVGLEEDIVASRIPPLSFEPFPTVPKHVPTRMELRNQLGTSITLLCNASAAFAAWRGEPLVKPIAKPLEPFEAQDPLHWFSATVSFLSCYVFDAVHDSFDQLVGYQWNPEASSIETTEPLPFFRTLRALRTVLQHGLNPDHNRDRESQAWVQQWCRAACGLPVIRRDVCRMLTYRLLQDWQEALDRLCVLVGNAMSSGNRAMVDAQLDLAMRRLPKYRWDELILEAQATLGLQEIDSEGFRGRNLNRWQQALQQIPDTGKALEDYARRLVLETLHEETKRCPITGDVLISAGFSQGKQLGVILAYLRERWENDDGLTKDELLTIAKERFPPP